MSAPLPNALRTRFQRYIEEGLSGRAAAMRLKVSAATGARWAQLIRTRGHAHPAPQGRPLGRGKLAPFQAFFEELVTQDPDITLFELRDALAMAKVWKFTIPPLPRCCRASASPIKKIAGGQRTGPRKGKAGPARLVDAPLACNAASAGTACVY
jgi:hypothetical protein